MCGLFGLATTEKLKALGARRAFVKDALIVGSVRGEDSTGVFGVSKPKKPAEYLKLALPGHMFYDTAVTQRFLDSMESYGFLVGHHRAATRGRINTMAAHPYQHGPITLVHNGTLHQYYNLTGGVKMHTDSEAIAYSIADIGAEETLKKVDGHFALLWHDATTGSLYAARNKHRPLYFCTIEKQDTILFASESGMLKWLAFRNMMDIKETYYVEEGTIIEFPFDNPLKWKIKEVELYAPLPKLPIKNTGNTGKTSGKKLTASTLDKEMRLAGFRRGGHVLFSPMSFTPKDNTGKRGKILGVTDATTYMHVVAWNASKLLVEDEGKCFLKGKIQGFVYDENGWPMLVLHKVIHTNKPDSQPIFNINEKDEEGDGAVCMGPQGKYIDVEKFKKLVADGCSMCAGEITPAESDLMMWVDYKSPLCIKCSIEWNGAH